MKTHNPSVAHAKTSA